MRTYTLLSAVVQILQRIFILHQQTDGFWGQETSGRKRRGVLQLIRRLVTINREFGNPGELGCLGQFHLL